MNTPSSGGQWHMAAAMVLSGTIGVLVTESGLSAWQVVVGRCAIGALGLAAWISLRRAWVRMSARQVAWTVLAGVALVLNWAALFSAYPLSGIGITTVVYHLQPLMLVLLTALVQRQRPDVAALGWLALAVVGVALTTGVELGGAPAAALWQGVALATAAAFLYALATLATRRISGVAPAQVATVQMVVGLALLAPFVAWPGAVLAGKPGAIVLVLGLVHTAWMYVMLYTAFQKLPVAQIANLSFIYPAVALLVDLYFYGTSLSAEQGVGLALIMLALAAQQKGLRLSRSGPYFAR